MHVPEGEIVDWPSEDYLKKRTHDELKQLKLKTIEWQSGRKFVRNLRLTLNNGDKSMTFGDKDQEVTEKFELDKDLVI